MNYFFIFGFFQYLIGSIDSNTKENVEQIKDDNQGSKNEGDRAHGFEQENNSNRQNTDFDQNQRKLSEEEKELYFTLNVIAPTSF
ncbi:hypothetical protein CWI38_2306p0020 [Hamiltosporidium tvaerminnensis]|uniref:Uncharacterized protein n=1 Tax=Hamiltosporidium tvaerminnensis TaxID=1176355 RepID=A0A4Q9LLS2_9MICR|nr:hypothetical protein CWI37_1849p0010 [Hamiltosporidium tvaerminnensis]TBU06778.1 hypothetical protein CWI38_2509p0020 [Hamiltosporidium tvaerminnensis]TBU08100.1 hypothetical protein CWI38_2306p0020 [Hamiltosporidium tvaerminnensis]